MSDFPVSFLGLSECIGPIFVKAAKLDKTLNFVFVNDIHLDPNYITTLAQWKN